MASRVQGVSESPFLQMPHTPEKSFCSMVCSCITLHFCCAEPPTPKPRRVSTEVLQDPLSESTTVSRSDLSEQGVAAADDSFRAGKLAIEKFVRQNQRLLRPIWQCENCGQDFLNQSNAEQHFFCQDSNGSFIVWTDSRSSSPSIIIVNLD